MENIRYLWHPLLPPGAPEFAFGWQFAWLVHRSGHHISEVVFGTFTIFQDPAAASRAEFAVEQGSAAVVRFVNGGLSRRFRGIGKRFHGNLSGKTESRSKEFLTSMEAVSIQADVSKW